VDHADHLVGGYVEEILQNEESGLGFRFRRVQGSMTVRRQGTDRDLDVMVVCDAIDSEEACVTVCGVEGHDGVGTLLTGELLTEG